MSDHHGYIDGFGNRCERLTIAAGAARIVYEAEVVLLSPSDRIAPATRETPIMALPDEQIAFLMPSRFCLPDVLGHEAPQRFGEIAPGWRVRRVGARGPDHEHVCQPFSADINGMRHGHANRRTRTSGARNRGRVRCRRAVLARRCRVVRTLRGRRDRARGAPRRRATAQRASGLTGGPIPSRPRSFRRGTANARVRVAANGNRASTVRNQRRGRDARP